ncbi:telomere repeats-binding bouquet formation protein 1 [Mantella aurantiaca]
MALRQMNVMGPGKSGEPLCSFEMKTDLKLLLECLKFQMDNPELQKDTLAAIRSICQNNSDACGYFREIGGFIFIISIVKCSTDLILKEVSFYTLGVLAESNVFCQQTLCTPELFGDVSNVLSDERSSVSLKRMSVFLALVLVSNNKAGQIFVRESGCIGLLLLLFGSSAALTPRMLQKLESGDLQYQLWLSVCSALCACVNNPQNEVNQKLCTSAFPQADKWLRCSVQPEIVRPICSLIGLSVASNRFAQDHFVSLGGLDTLASILLQLMNVAQADSLDCRLAVVVSKTLDACIADNPRAVHHLSKYSIVSSLITLLSHRSLDPEDRFCIVLTLGHCTENCEPNQYELLRSRGLPLMIQVLTESQDDEIHKAATFVLQNCRSITEKLSLSLGEHSPNVKQTSTWNILENYDDEFWEKAKEIYHKIEHLDKQHDEDIVDIEEPEGRDRSHNQRCRVHTASAVSKLSFLNSHSRQQSNDPNVACSSRRSLEQSNNLAQTLQKYTSYPSCTDQGSSAHRYNAPKEITSQQAFSDTAAKHKSPASTSGPSNKSDSDNHTAVQDSHTGSMCRNKSCRSHCSRKDPSSKHAFTQTAEHHTTENSQDNFLQPWSELFQEGRQTSPHGHSVCNSRANSARNLTSINKATNLDPMTICADIINKEIGSILHCYAPQTQLRCSGCLVTRPSMNSRNCSNILQKCPHLCDRHRVILQAEEQYKAELRKLLCGARISTPHNSMLLTPIRTGKHEAGQSRQKQCIPRRILLTPMRKKVEEDQDPDRTECLSQIIESDLDLERPKDSHGKKQEIINNKPQSLGVQTQDLRNPDQTNSKRVTRKDFTQKEITDLLDGVSKFGRHWNAILWSYPFQKGRSNVDLAKKYKHLQMQQTCKSNDQ